MGWTFKTTWTLTAADIAILDRVRIFHIWDISPVVIHYVAEPFPTTSKYSIAKEGDKKETEDSNTNEK